MLLGLLADSHDHRAAVRLVAAEFDRRGVGFVVHAGDVTDAATLRELAAFRGAVVLGNNDEERALTAAADAMGWACATTWTGTLAGRRVAAAHGHDRGAVASLLASRPHVLVVGHSHRARDGVVDGVRVVNPGALFRAPRYTAATLDLASGRLDFLPVPKAAAGF